MYFRVARALWLSLAAALAIPTAWVLSPPAAIAQPAGAAFKAEELDQMLAPIALYPDSLLSQLLMAATYPLEVVEAARWSKANPTIKGDAAIAAIQDKSWDVSVKSLVAFPQVIQQMSEQLEWTQKLGDAMLSQQQDVAASIQRLRKMAADAGTLKSTEQQKVTVQQVPSANGAAPQTIVIEPASPQYVYVPVYQPVWAYGIWPYAAYPPYYYPPLPLWGYGTPLLRGFMWGAGVAAANAVFGGWNWGRGDININIDRAINIDRNIDRNRWANGNWQHNPAHRKAVPYRDAATRERFGQTRPGTDARREFRGRELQQPGGGDRPGLDGPRPGGGDRPGIGGQRPGGDGPGGGVQRPGGGAGGAAQRPATQPRQQIDSGQRGGAIQGVDRGGQRVSREAARGRGSEARSGQGRGGGGAGGGGGRGGGRGGR